MIFGAITRSVSIIADGANNIFDAVSSVISLVGFKISGKPADKDHPFGHGRVEYVSALTLAFVIIMMGIELIKSSVEKFSDPEKVIFSVPAVIVLVFSIAAKIWLAAFNKKIGKKINSVSVDAVVADSIGDIAATTCSLIALVASKFTDLPVDAVMGIIVAGVILYAGIGIIRDTLGPLLGEPPEKETVTKLEELVLSHENIIGIHDLVLHGYGHGKVFGSLHAEVPSDCDMLHIHDTIDLIEKIYKSYYADNYSLFIINYQAENEYNFIETYQLRQPLEIVLVRINDGAVFGYQKIRKLQEEIYDPISFTQNFKFRVNEFLGNGGSNI